MRPASGSRRRDGERAVSEIMGVSMLLAMVITTMGGVMVMMQPFMQDLNDNREWASASVAANQFNDRLLVAAEAPNGSGIMVSSAHIAEIIGPIRLSEVWQISADLVGEDRVSIDFDMNEIELTSLNGTAHEIIISTPLGIQNATIEDGNGQLTVNLVQNEWMQIDVLDIQGSVIHRWVQIPLDGVQLSTTLTEGEFNVDLINGARIEKLGNQPIDVRLYPRFGHDLTLQSQHRVSLIMLDVDMEGTGQSSDFSLELISEGPKVFFEEEVRNLKIVTDFASQDGREAKFRHQWNGDYEFHRATGDLDEFSGFGPYGRISGVEGMTMYPTTEAIQLDVILQQVVVK